MEIRPTKEFLDLENRWKLETGFHSSLAAIYDHPAYQEIIALGKENEDIISMILYELRKRNAHWYGALIILTGANPVQWQDAGHMKEMRKTWLDWGCDNRYLNFAYSDYYLHKEGTVYKFLFEVSHYETLDRLVIYENVFTPNHPVDCQPQGRWAESAEIFYDDDMFRQISMDQMCAIRAGKPLDIF